MVNARTQASNLMQNKVYEHLSKNGPQTLDDLSLALGLHYKTVYSYVAKLQDKGLVRVAGFKDKKYTYEAGRPSIIPSIPTSTGPVALMEAIKIIAHAPDTYMSVFDQNSERFNYYLAALMRQTLAYNEETGQAIAKYLRVYREQLDLRIRVINVLLKEDKFWNADGCAQMTEDPTFNKDTINKAFSRENEKINAVRRAEFKKESTAKDPLAD